MMRSFKKRYQRAQVFFAEKFGSERAANAGEHYEQLCTLTDQCKKMYEDIKKRSVECVQPSGNMLNIIKPGDASANADFAHCPEQKLSECFSTYANALKGGQPFAKVLNDAAEAFHRLAAGRLQAMDDMKAVVVAPLRATLNEDIKELTNMRKETEKLRRTLEYEHKRVEKGTISESHPEYVEAKRRYEDKLSMTESALLDFHDGEAEQLMIIGQLADTLHEYYKSSAALLLELQQSVRTSSENLKNNPKARCRVDNVGSGSSNNSMKAEVTHLAKHPGGAQPTPMCRALFDFEAKSPTELNFSEGDIILLLEQVDENWFLGSLNGVKGHFPTTYVQVIVPLP